MQTAMSQNVEISGKATKNGSIRKTNKKFKVTASPFHFSAGFQQHSWLDPKSF
jgi:hypothetical protein